MSDDEETPLKRACVSLPDEICLPPSLHKSESIHSDEEGFCATQVDELNNDLSSPVLTTDPDLALSSIHTVSTPLVCSLCEESSEDVDGSEIISHCCTQCRPDAWQVCLACNDALLSRTCPYCRGPYAPLMLYDVPGRRIRELADTTLSSEEHSALLYKFGIIRRLIEGSNVVAWSAKQQRLFFSLPEFIMGKPTSRASAVVIESQKQDEENRTINNEETNEGNTKLEKELTHAIVSLSLPLDGTEESLGETFSFTNELWDRLESEIEDGQLSVGEMVDAVGAAQFILPITKEDDHRLYTMMQPSTWQFMLDTASEDTAEALSQIRSKIHQKTQE